ncbi:MAG: flagellar export chaperone FliS [Anaerolineales bacterium]
MIKTAYGTQQYRTQDVLGATPLHLVVMAYDVAIVACEKGDYERATKAISLLRDALNFDYAEAAGGLFRLYQWCLDCIRQGDYQSALQTLKELREAWATVENRYRPIVTTPAYAPAPVLGQSA